MKRFALVCLLATGAVAVHAETFIENARVRAVEPQYENVATPRQECSTQVINEQRPVGGGQNYGGAVLGGVVGGLLGNQVGGGHGREAATAAGAVVGALTGDRLANNQPQQYQVVPREVTNCRTVNDVQPRLTGYRVTYDWRGQEYTTFMRDNPGRDMRVRVSVEPVTR
jgi:uncharacterized protein YcfJ